MAQLVGSDEDDAGAAVGSGGWDAGYSEPAQGDEVDREEAAQARRAMDGWETHLLLQQQRGEPHALGQAQEQGQQAGQAAQQAAALGGARPQKRPREGAEEVGAVGQGVRPMQRCAQQEELYVYGAA